MLHGTSIVEVLWCLPHWAAWIVPQDAEEEIVSEHISRERETAARPRDGLDLDLLDGSIFALHMCGMLSRLIL